MLREFRSGDYAAWHGEVRPHEAPAPIRIDLLQVRTALTERQGRKGKEASGDAAGDTLPFAGGQVALGHALDVTMRTHAIGAASAAD